MKFFIDLRASVALIGALSCSVSLVACASGGAQSANQGAVPAVAQPGTMHSWGSRAHFEFERMMSGLNLSDRQRAQIHQLVQQYRQAHPRGSVPDLKARRELHQQILAVLTPQQQAKLKEIVAKIRDHRMVWRSLSDSQRTRIRKLLQDYRQAHPWGTAFDGQAHQQLHEQILAILTPQQRTELKQSF
jgi:Spy/CpxP family protein refolding chaperone